MGRLKTNYPKRFTIFAIAYFILFSTFIALRGFQAVAIDVKLIIVTVLIIYFNYIDLKGSKSFHISFNIPVIFYIFLLYPIKFILPYSFILIFIVFFVKKLIQKRNVADAFVISFFSSGVQSSYILLGIYIFHLFYPYRFSHIGITQSGALLLAFLSMALSNFLIYCFINYILMQNKISKNDFTIFVYSSLSDLVLFLLFLPLYILTVNNMNGMALFYILAVYALIRIFYNILSVRVNILVYADLIKKLSELVYNIDDYDSIEKSIVEYFRYLKSNIYLENIYFYRGTYENTLEITPDNKKIFRYLLPEIRSLTNTQHKFCEIAKGQIKHYPFKVLYLCKTNHNREIGGLLVSLLTNNKSPYLFSFSKILFNRLNAILDLHLDKKENRELLENIISILVSSIEGSSKEVLTHSKRVAIIASGIAEKLGYSREKTELFKYAGLLHDIGVVTYSRAIYAKKSKNELTDEEWNMIKNHPRVGYDVLKNIKSLGDVPLWILDHHERYDGAGFPNGKKGKEISDGGMILNIANVFDSFLFGKTYMNKVPVNMAVKYIIQGKGTLFDPDLINRIQNYLEAIANNLIKNTEH